MMIHLQVLRILFKLKILENYCLLNAIGLHSDLCLIIERIPVRTFIKDAYSDCCSGQVTRAHWLRAWNGFQAIINK